MSDYEITRVRWSDPTEAGHQHVIAVEINGQPRLADEVYVLIRQGDVFYTRSSSGQEPVVEPWFCCEMRTLRSHIKAEQGGNLNDLSAF